MKIARSADWHFRSSDLDAAFAQATALADRVIDEGCDLLVIPGDIFHRATIHDEGGSTGQIAEAVILILDRIARAGVQIVIVDGDHDIPGAGARAATTVLDHRHNIHVFHRPGTWTTRDIESGDKPLAIACVPWQWGASNAEEVIAQIVDNARSLGARNIMLLAHVSVDGMRLNHAIAAEHAPEKLARSRTWRVSRAFIESLPVSWIALGDYHLRQAITPTAHYIGALRQLGYGEEGNPAGFDILDTETGEITWIELDAAPKHLDVFINHEGNENEITDLSAIAALEAAEQRGAKIRTIFDGVKPDPVLIRQLEARGIRVDQPIDRAERTSRADIPEGILSDPAALIQLYARHQTPPLPDERVARLIAAHEQRFADKPVEFAGV